MMERRSLPRIGHPPGPEPADPRPDAKPCLRLIAGRALNEGFHEGGGPHTRLTGICPG